MPVSDTAVTASPSQALCPSHIATVLTSETFSRGHLTFNSLLLTHCPFNFSYIARLAINDIKFKLAQSTDEQGKRHFLMS
jgi:hypothetical protein